MITLLIFLRVVPYNKEFVSCLGGLCKVSYLSVPEMEEYIKRDEIFVYFRGGILAYFSTKRILVLFGRVLWPDVNTLMVYGPEYSHHQKMM